MREYFIVMVKEGETTNLKLLAEKLNQGFTIDRRDDIGRSMMYILKKNNYEVNERSSIQMPVGRAYSGEETATESLADIPF